MKKFTIPCDFAGTKARFDIYVGAPVPDAHPLEQQMAWLRRERGGHLPAEAADSFAKLHQIALENGVSFEELCVYALGTASESTAEPTMPAEAATPTPTNAAESDAESDTAAELRS